MGTTLSTLVTVFWTQPWIVYKNLFEKSVRSYFFMYIFYLALTVGMTFLTSTVCNRLIEGTSFMSLIYRGIIILIIPNLICVLIFYRSTEFKYLYNIMSLGLKINILIPQKLKLLKNKRI